jgi:ferritin-like metal-binding protein YciE
MEGLIEEGKSIMEDTEKDTMTRGASLILAAQKAEHYEIATYGTLRVFAKTMERDDIAELLNTILENEKMTGAALTEIAESFVNESAIVA